MCAYKDKTIFEDWDDMLNYVENECFMYKSDIKQGYHHIDIKPKNQKYLGFAWEINGKVPYFVLNVLSFGLISVPFILTKTMRVLVKRWRETIVKIYCFLDDGSGVQFKFHKAFPSSEFVRNSLTQPGFVVNQEKSVCYLTANMTWLRINLYFDIKIISMSDKRFFYIKSFYKNY